MSEETVVTLDPTAENPTQTSPETPPEVPEEAGEAPVDAEAATAEDAGEAPSSQEVAEASSDEPAEGEAATGDAAESTQGGREPAATAVEPEAVESLRAKMEKDQPVRGKVIGWNNGGFHVVVDGMTAFCPRSEIEIEASKAPKTYLDKDLIFRILKIENAGKRIVLSRSNHLRAERRLARDKVKDELKAGSVVRGRVASLTDFGAFVDLGGVQGLVHISELSRSRVEHPSEVVKPGQEVAVKILRIENNGKRISLSMKALEPDPWEGVEKRFEEGAVVTGTVERTAKFGAFIQLEPGLTGLLPTSVMSLPRDASPARMFPAGREVSVQIQSIDRRRRRISLSLEGSQMEGSRKDYESYRQDQGGSGGGFNALAAALEKARVDAGD